MRRFLDISKARICASLPCCRETYQPDQYWEDRNWGKDVKSTLWYDCWECAANMVRSQRQVIITCLVKSSGHWHNQIRSHVQVRQKQPPPSSDCELHHPICWQGHMIRNPKGPLKMLDVSKVFIATSKEYPGWSGWYRQGGDVFASSLSRFTDSLCLRLKAITEMGVDFSVSLKNTVDDWL